MTKVNKQLLQAGLATAVIGMANFSYAASFKLLEADAGGLGNRYSGAAVKEDDATTNFFNAAGLTSISGPQLSLGGTLILPRAKMKGTVTQGTTTTFDDNGGKAAVVPNFHFATPLNDKWAFGFGVSVPFGLSTDWSGGEDGSGASRAATLSEIKTIDYNANLAYQVNDQLSVGGGVSLQYLDATLAAYAKISSPPIPAPIDTEVKNSGDSYGLGFNLGMMYDVTPATKLGLSYRSAVKHKLRGTSTRADTGASSNITADVKLPDTVLFSASHMVNDQLSLMGTVEFTRWSTIKSIVIKNTVVGGGADSTTTYDYKDTWRFALGARYILNEQWSLTGGLDYDQTPTNDTHRDMRLPDQSRIGVGLGFKYTHNDAMSVDVGGSYLHFKKVKINSTNGVGAVTSAEGRPSAFLLGAQFNWKL